jgi:CPA1 family monovalent cation:H+ antiporter
VNFIEPAIFILLFAILSVPIATRFHLPLEIFLVIGSCIISLSPWMPTFQLDPHIVFNLFLPPILFYAAYFTSWRDLKFNFRPISLLAFGLVVITMIVVAIISKLVLSEFTWAECFLLGAIISPTDATSATSIIKKLGAPRRIITILEGESLVNDATALILFRFSLAVILGSSFSLPQAAGHFVLVAAGGIILGLVAGGISTYLLPKINSVVAETTFTFITAFTCYLVSESVGVSGIIATVVCGIYCGMRFPEIVSSFTRVNAKASWNTLIFIINGFVFTLIGLELPLVIKNLQADSLSMLILYGLIISVVVIFIRLIWVYPMAYLPRLFFASIEYKDPMPSWKILFLVGWSGMRGIVSLAAALSIPFFLSPGIAFPHRDLIIFITYCVIVVTLIVPTLSLPIILSIFHLTDEEDEMKQEAIARIYAIKNSMKHIEELAHREKIPSEIINDFRKQLSRRLKVVKTQLNEKPYSTLTNEYLALKRLVLTAIESERRTLLELRKSGEIHDEVFHRLSDELDIEEMRTKTLRI